MPEGVEVDLVQLPEAIVLAWGVQSLRVKGTDGEEHAVVVIDLQFQIEPGRVGQQSFLLHKSDAKGLRESLKNPPPAILKTTPQEEKDKDPST